MGALPPRSLEKELSALLCLVTLGLCLFLIPPNALGEDSVLLRWVSPFAACFTVDPSFGLFGLVSLSGLAGALYTQL
jgi:hypothetical protein